MQVAAQAHVTEDADQGIMRCGDGGRLTHGEHTGARSNTEAASTAAWAAMATSCRRTLSTLAGCKTRAIYAGSTSTHRKTPLTYPTHASPSHTFPSDRECNPFHHACANCSASIIHFSQPRRTTSFHAPPHTRSRSHISEKTTRMPPRQQTPAAQHSPACNSPCASCT